MSSALGLLLPAMLARMLSSGFARGFNESRSGNRDFGVYSRLIDSTQSEVDSAKDVSSVGRKLVWKLWWACGVIADWHW